MDYDKDVHEYVSDGTVYETYESADRERMIPGRDVNHMSGIRISKSNIDKWQRYELSLDKLLMYCDTLSNNNKERII